MKNEGLLVVYLENNDYFYFRFAHKNYFRQFLCDVNLMFPVCRLPQTLNSKISPMGHLYDDVILLLLPESFRVLLSCAN